MRKKGKTLSKAIINVKNVRKTLIKMTRPVVLSACQISTKLALVMIPCFANNVSDFSMKKETKEFLA